LHVLKLNGALKSNPGRFAGRSDPPAFPGGIGDPPVQLSVAKTNIWYELIGQLPEGHLQSADHFLATGLMARLRNRKTLVTQGEIALLMNALSKLGPTPVDSAKVHFDEPTKPEAPGQDDL